MALLQDEAGIALSEPLAADVNRSRRAREESLGVYQQLLATDPSNTTWLYNPLMAEIHLLSLVPPDQWTAREFRGLERVESKLAGSSTADASDKDYVRLKFRAHHPRNVVQTGRAAPVKAPGLRRHRCC